MRSGTCFERSRSARRTAVSGSSYSRNEYPTPSAAPYGTSQNEGKVAHKADSRHSGPRDVGKEPADACRDALEGREPVCQTRPASSHKRRGGELGDADGGRCEAERGGRLPDRRQAERGYDAHRHGSGTAWPPGPQDEDGWRAYLAAGGPAPAFSKLRGSTDGLPSGMEFRADRLRCLGNGVVRKPQELAWLTLKARLEQE